MERYAPGARRDAYGSRLNRTHFPWLAGAIPWVSIAVASILPLPIIATALPLMPPLGFLMLLAWRFVRPGLLPVWAGVPLGLFDDLLSGQPFGFAIFFWSSAMLLIEVIESRWPWRSFWQDWFTAGILATGYLVGGWLMSGAPPALSAFVAMLPQLVMSILAFPVLSRLVARLDVARLRRWRQV